VPAILELQTSGQGSCVNCFSAEHFVQANSTYASLHATRTCSGFDPGSAAVTQSRLHVALGVWLMIVPLHAQRQTSP